MSDYCEECDVFLTKLRRDNCPMCGNPSISKEMPEIEGDTNLLTIIEDYNTRYMDD
jgi:RNA polymerase subunit RPABC4/transcription elongation factor Spt4